MIRRAVVLTVVLWFVALGLCGDAVQAGEEAVESKPGMVLVPEPPEHRRMMEQYEYIHQGWSNGDIYVDGNAVPSPERERQLLELPPGAVFTALADRPCGPSAVVGAASAGGSSLTEVWVSREGRSGRVLLESSALGEDVWFGEPTSQSPGGRWLLVTVRPGRGKLFEDGPPEAEEAAAARRAPGALYLIDCVQQGPPSLVESNCLLAAAAWSLSGDRVACTLRLEDGWAVVLVTPLSGERRALLERPAQAVWSLGGSRLRLFSLESGQPSESVCDLESGGIESEHSSGPSARGATESLWAQDASIFARVDVSGDEVAIELATADAAVRRAPASRGVDRLLGWSCEGQLLAYRDGTGGLQFTSGTRSEPVFKRIVAAQSSFPRSKRLPEALVGGMCLDTTFTPVALGEDVLAGWARTSEGPCFLHTAREADRPPRLSAIYFWERTLLELGVDLRQDLRWQTIRDVCDANLAAIHMAVREYAADHAGRYPPHESGPELASDLDGYGEPALFMGSAYAPDEYRVRLLHPGRTRKEILGEANARGETDVPLLELTEDGGLIFEMYTGGEVWMTRSDGSRQLIESWAD